MFKRRRVHTPTVLQMEAVECGAASLSMILGYFGRHVSLEDLRIACGVSRDGTKASNIMHAGRQFGLKTRAFKKEIKDLAAIRLPAVIFWNFNHFLVLEGLGRNCFYLNDPARGKVKASPEEFNRSFTGIVLTFEKTPEFRKGGRRPSVLRSLATRLPGTSVALLFLVLATLTLAIPGLIAPAFQRIFIDNIVIGGASDWLAPLLTAIAAVALLRAALTLLQQRTLRRLELRLAVEGSSRFLRHLIRLPIGFFLQRTAADVSARVSINDRVASLLSGDLAASVVSILTAGFYAALMFSYDRTLGAIGVAFALINLLVLRYVAKTRVAANERLQRERSALLSASMSGLQAMETLKASGAESDFYAKWAGIQAKVMNREQALNRTTEIVSSLPSLLLAINTALVLAIGGERVMDGALTMGALVTFQVLLNSFFDPVQQLMAAGDKLPEVQASMRRLDDVLNYPADPRLAASDAPPTAARLEGYLELRNITFGYSRLEPPLIENFNLTLEPGRRIALVGGSGSGKSTVAKVASGLFEPWSGEVLLDGQSRDSVPRPVITSSIGMVDQEIFLFEGSVRDNIAMWDPHLAEPDIIAAARDACIHDDIASRPGGYDYKVEEGGRNFSGGQRQRLEIARALAFNPRILILDEATSALDPKTELLFDDRLRRRGCACLIVAHRLSTIRDCDEIIVMHLGKIVERGHHAQLMSAGGHYARLMANA